MPLVTSGVEHGNLRELDDPNESSLGTTPVSPLVRNAKPTQSWGQCLTELPGPVQVSGQQNEI